MKPLSVKSFLPGIAWFFVILYLICMPGDEIPEPTGWWEWIKLIQFDKIVHMGIFALLVFLFMLPIARAPFSRKKKAELFLLIVLSAIAWGMGTELIQKFFIPTRFFDMMDFTADSIGATISYFATRKYLLNHFEHTPE